MARPENPSPRWGRPWRRPTPRPRPRSPHKPGQMTRTEQLYAIRLEALRLTGEIVAWSYETRRFRLAYRTWYTPDFEVVSLEDIQYHEVKAGRRRAPPGRPGASLALWEDDARVKWKQAAELFPHFRWMAASLEGTPQRWQLEEAATGGVRAAPAALLDPSHPPALGRAIVELLRALRASTPEAISRFLDPEQKGLDFEDVLDQRKREQELPKGSGR